ncbi:MAG: aa3-type cytochrome oxidase subunit II [Candidatus Nanopelagicales bacterium]
MALSNSRHLGDVSGKRRAVRAGALVLGATTVALLASGCTANEAFFFDLPTPATAEAPIIQNLWQGSWIAAWAVGAVTLILILWAVFAYRRRRNSDVPEQTKYNLPIEVLYTIVPLVMILGLFWFTAKDQSEILTVENDQKQTVNVVGWKWSWGFNYIDEQVFESGTPDYVPTLVLPINEKVRFELTSPDVIHSFWVPAFLFKMDVIPGKTNVFELTPNKLGTFAGKCTELCGTYHSGMLFNVKVVERPEFDAFVESLKARGNTGLLDTGRTTNEGAIPGERTL